MAAWLAKQTLEGNNSFCGPFCYESNVPMKVFAGNQAAVPTAFVLEALAQMQQGGSTEKQVYAMGKSLTATDMETCPSTCNADFVTCISQTGAQKIEDIDGPMLQSCISTHSNCNKIC